MKVTVTYNDKSVQVNLTDAQLETLGLKEKKKPTGYERVGMDEDYYYTEWCGDYDSTIELGEINDDLSYNSGNYFSDANLAKANARADKLMWKLRRFAAENGGIPSVGDWHNHNKDKWYILFDYNCEHLLAGKSINMRNNAIVYFNSAQMCKNAIEEFKDELTWYFTEYQAMLY